jgi:hypothetical protein
MNRAIGQVKKMWLQSSKSLQRAHRPFNGPIRLATCLHEGNLLRISCQRKIFIFGGTLTFHTSLKQVTIAPCERHMCIELVKN